MSFQKKYSICRSCTNARLHKKIGLFCSLTQTKPSFYLYCSTFNLSKSRDDKLDRKRASFYTDNEVIIWTILIIIFLIQIIISKYYFLLIILLGGAGYFYYSKFFISNQHNIIQKIGHFGYSYLSLSAVILKSKQNINYEYKLIYQKLLREYGYEIANQGLKLLKDLILEEINIKEICTENKKKYSLSDKILIYYLLFEVTVCGNNEDTENNNIFKIITKELEINEKQKEFVKNQIFKDKQKEEKKQSKRKRKFDSNNLKTDEIQNFYTVLGITADATNIEIKKAFRQLALQFHPDKADITDIEQQKEFKIKFQAILNAYEIIKNIRKFK